MVMIGADGPKNLPGYPEKQSDENGDWTVVERYWVKENILTDSLPAHHATVNQFGETVTDPDANTLKCISRVIQRGEAPDVRIVELTYSQTSTTWTPRPANDNPKAVRVLYANEIPIDDERLLTTNGGIYTSTDIEKARAAEYETLVLPTAEYTYTELDANFSWTESDIVDNLFVTGAPAGVGGATASKWRIAGREIDDSENEVKIKTVYEFNNSGFVPIHT